MRKATFILLAFTALLAWSCLKDVFPTEMEPGYGGIELRLDSSNAIRLETKALTPAQELAEGLRFTNVLVILTNSSGKVVSNVYKTYPYTNQGGSDIQDSEAATSATEDVIHFTHLLPGNYHVYAYANIDATAWQATGGDLISAQEKAVAAGASFSGFLDRELLALTANGSDVPADPTSMLLTGHMTIPVGLSVVPKTLDMIRPVVRFKVTVRNHTRFPVTVDAMSFSHFNPDRAYLLDHRDDSGVPSVPTGVNYRALPAFDPSASAATVAAEDEGVVYQTLLYENAAPSPYEICASFSMDRSTESLTPLSVYLGTVGVGSFGPITYTLLNSLPVGTYVDVLLINPRITTRAGRLYYGVGDTNYAWESCGYDKYDKFLTRATKIYNEETYTYTEYQANGVWNATYGHAGWTGNSGDSPKYDNAFDYRNGVGSSRFRRITKNGANDYSVAGLSSTTTSLEGVNIVQGVYPTAGRFPDDLPGNLLVRFTKNNKNLKSDFLYNNNNDTQAYKAKLVWDTQNNHDHQFILFGYYKPEDSGVPMKRILKENNKEVPLTYMARNEEVNVVINVYYADQEGSLDFVVDNSHWTAEAATSATHTFN